MINGSPLKQLLVSRVGISVSADITHIGKTDISVSAIIPDDILADMQYLEFLRLYHWGMYAWILIKARISADGIGCDKSISAYRLLVKFNRYIQNAIVAPPPMLVIWAKH